MNKLLLCVMIVLLAATTSMADKVNGVLAEERVISLPQDQNKWYISVVGDPQDARYLEVTSWFNVDPSLKKLRTQVHFVGVTSDMAIFKSRYAPNVKSLPTVRMQKSDGEVVYEQSGVGIPMTSAGLYGAMADAAQSAQGLRPLLPWRRDMERRVDNEREPAPQPEPDVTPEPPNHQGAPVFDDRPLTEGSSYVFLPLAMLVGFGAGVVLGYGKTFAAKVYPGVR